MITTVRQVESAHIPLLTESFPDSPGTPINKHAQRFDRQSEGHITYLAAWGDSRIVGYVLVRWLGYEGITKQGAQMGCAEIGDLTVAEQFRGRGIGRQLMEASEEQAQKRKIAQLGLEVTAINPSQNVARILYDHLGYKECGLGTFTSGYTYWDNEGNAHRDEEAYIYLIKNL